MHICNLITLSGTDKIKKQNFRETFLNKHISCRWRELMTERLTVDRVTYRHKYVLLSNWAWTLSILHSAMNIISYWRICTATGTHKCRIFCTFFLFSNWQLANNKFQGQFPREISIFRILLKFYAQWHDVSLFLHSWLLCSLPGPCVS